MDKNDIEKTLYRMNAELYKDGVSLEFARQVIMNMLNWNLIIRCDNLKDVYSYLNDLTTEGKKAATAGWPFKSKMLEKMKLEHIN